MIGDVLFGEINMVETTLFDELLALESCAFPKKCQTCGRTYQCVEEFTSKTHAINGKSGLKAAEDDNGSTVLELFRNCICGSTLLDFFADRRDLSEQGTKRRQIFEKILTHLTNQGLDRSKARLELKLYLKTRKSDWFEKLGLLPKI